MEITYQNRIEDLVEYHQYLLHHTEEGKRAGVSYFLLIQVISFSLSVILGLFIWLISSSWLNGVSFFIFIFIASELFLFIRAKFKPFTYYSEKYIRKQGLKLTNWDESYFLLPKKLSFDDRGIDLTADTSKHHASWKFVAGIAQSADYIFIKIKNFGTLIVPRRAFQSQQSYVDFGNTLLESLERHRADEQ